MLFEFVNFPLNSTLSVTYRFNMQCLSSFKLFISIMIFSLPHELFKNILIVLHACSVVSDSLQPYGL